MVKPLQKSPTKKFIVTQKFEAKILRQFVLIVLQHTVKFEGIIQISKN